jgi:thiamine pyrophosphate-dependent acetolactate synthase large subunit-like protein
MAISNVDAVRILDEQRHEGIICSTMTANSVNHGLPSVSKNESLDFPMGGAMGKGSSLALGLALAQPDRKILLLDGDGSLLMNLGSLVTVSNKAPENLYHFVFENGVYAITGGQPVPGSGKTSFTGMAREAGYAAVYEFDDTEEFATGLHDVLHQKGPVLICLKITPVIENTPVQFRDRPTRTTQIAIKELHGIFTG